LLFGAVATRSDAGGHHRRLLPRAAAAVVAAGVVVSSPRRGGGSTHNHRRWAPAPFRACLLALWLLGFALVFLWQSTSMGRVWLYTRPPMPKHAVASLGQWAASPPVYDLREFGAVGDGRTVNTVAFESAIAAIAVRGGGRLTVPAGRWLTTPFNLTVPAGRAGARCTRVGVARVRAGGGMAP
jgi:polygalacturonase